MNTRVLYSILFYLLIVVLVTIVKPKPFFDADKNTQAFGVGDGKTIFPLGVLVVLLSLVCYYFVTLVDLIFD